MLRPTFLLLSCCCCGAVARDHITWSDYAGAPDSAQYSRLSQVNRSNVSRLQVAWMYPTGDRRSYAFNPLVVDDVAYVLAHDNSIVALNAATGAEIWRHKGDVNSRLITNRGINYWENADRSERRLFCAENNILHALDARTGERIGAFGDRGGVDLRQGLGRNPESIVLVQSTTPGRVFEHYLILGSAPNQEYESAPGDIRAYDVVTGKLAWSFHTVPRPGEYGYDTWPPDAWKTVGGANAWSELTIDGDRGVVYVPTGSPKYNFYGANRVGANLFGDCLLALDARNGRRLWHFQMVHHDIWDYDNPTAPKLLTLRHEGRVVQAVVQVGKQGFVWVFDRETGQPLWPIEERPVPQSDVPGEQTWPTQPFPRKPPPFARQKFTIDDLSPYISNPAERTRWRDDLQSARNFGLFTPPSTRNTVQMPGNNGGANWGSAAVDADAGLLYVVSKDLPAMLKLEPEIAVQSRSGDSPEVRGATVYQTNCQVCHHADLKGQPPAIPALLDLKSRLRPEQVTRVVTQGGGLMPGNSKLSGRELSDLNAFLLRPFTLPANPLPAPKAVPQRYRSGFNFMITSEGLSPIAPPWTTLTAYDLNEGVIRWQVPLGEVPKLAARGIHNTGSHFPKVGPVVTAGGLIFTGTHDGKVRALDVANGHTIWEYEATAPLEGMPAVYQVHGKQYILFCAAAQPARGLPPATAAHAREPPGGAYLAFALPDHPRR